jgi:hypothetical protein
MVRKFKHQKTNAIATRTAWGGYSLAGADVHHIILPADYIENSNDWVEINEEPILKTEDDYEVYEGGKEIYLVNPRVMRIVRRLANDCTESDCKYFYYKENAQAYIERHKPKYSDRDLEALKRHIKEDRKISVYVFNASLEYTQGAIDAYNKAERLINELKASKND